MTKLKEKGKESGREKPKVNQQIIKPEWAELKERFYVQIQNLKQKNGIVWYVVKLTQIQIKKIG